jgi:eukaryotic-like serine/threonine-protein kinase
MDSEARFLPRVELDAERPALDDLGPVRERREPASLHNRPPADDLGSAATTDRALEIEQTTTLPVSPPCAGPTPTPISGEVLSSRRVADIGPGTRIGDYEIDAWLDRGGFGDVYRATHTPHREARAIKVLHSDLASTRAAVLRFEREVETIRRIEHPNVIRIESYGQLGDGRPWFAMELLRGQDLADHIVTRGRLSPREVLAILEPLAAALDAVHARGVVHRDLKPSNVFLDERDGAPRVVLLDFGVAKLLDDTGPGLTASLQVIGTPAFMAPEQIRGQPAGPRCDIYALGAIVHAMLTGEPPFAGADDAVGLLQLHLHTRPPRVSSRAPVDPAFDKVVLRALSKQPDQRQPSAGELLDDFRRALGAALPAAEAGTEPSAGAPRGTGDPTPRAAAVHVGVRTDDASLDDPDDRLLADLETVLPRAAALLTRRGLRAALEMGNAALFLLDLPPDAAAEKAARAGLLAAALALHDDLATRPGRDERVEVSVCLHAGVSMESEHGKCALLDVAAWVPEPAAGGVHASAEMLAGTPFTAGGATGGLLRAVERPLCVPGT